MAFTNLRTTLDMAEWDAATVKINYALKSAVPTGRSAVLNMAKLSGPSEITVMRFTIRDNGGDYAIVTLDSTYLLSIHSSHGTWAYRWHDTGDRTTFVENLLQMNAPYLTGKLNGSRPEVFDDVATVRNITTDIIKLRKSMHISKDLARSLFDDAFDVHNVESLDDYIEMVRNELGDVRLETYEWYCHTTYEPGIKNFISSMWPVVRQCLQTVVAEFAK